MIDSPAESFTRQVSAEVPPNWTKELSGRLVTFGEGEDLAWGVEVGIPVEKEAKEFLAGYGIQLPDAVTTVRFLTLVPQESLPPEQRTIRSQKTDASVLQLLVETGEEFKTFTNTRPGERPYEYLARQFIKVLPTDENKRQFFDLVSSSKASEVLIVQGHGGGDPQSIGEKYQDTPQSSEGEQLQRTGNNVLVEEVLAKYNDNAQLSVILLDSCYTGSQKLRAKNIPVFYIQGSSSMVSSTSGANITHVALPEQV